IRVYKALRKSYLRMGCLNQIPCLVWLVGIPDMYARAYAHHFTNLHHGPIDSKLGPAMSFFTNAFSPRSSSERLKDQYSKIQRSFLSLLRTATRIWSGNPIWSVISHRRTEPEL